MQKRRKIVAAGWYVSSGLVFVLVAIPPEWLNSTPTRVLLFVLGVICLSGAAYEWWFRKGDPPMINYAGQLLIALDKQVREDRLLQAAQATERSTLPREPDVTLEFANTGPFILRNFGGTACEVRIDCATINEGQIYDVSFPMVPDLHDAPVIVAPDYHSTDVAGSSEGHYFRVEFCCAG